MLLLSTISFTLTVGPSASARYIVSKAEDPKSVSWYSGKSYTIPTTTENTAYGSQQELPTPNQDWDSLQEIYKDWPEELVIHDAPNRQNIKDELGKLDYDGPSAQGIAPILSEGKPEDNQIMWGKEQKRDVEPNFAAISDTLREGPPAEHPPKSWHWFEWERYLVPERRPVWDMTRKWQLVGDPAWTTFKFPPLPREAAVMFCHRAVRLLDWVDCFYSSESNPLQIWVTDNTTWDLCINQAEKPLASCFNDRNHSSSNPLDTYEVFPDTPLTVWDVSNGLACAQPLTPQHYSKVHCWTLGLPPRIRIYHVNTNDPKQVAQYIFCFQHYEWCMQLFYGDEAWYAADGVVPFPPGMVPIEDLR